MCDVHAHLHPIIHNKKGLATYKYFFTLITYDENTP